MEIENSVWSQKLVRPGAHGPFLVFLIVHSLVPPTGDCAEGLIHMHMHNNRSLGEWRCYAHHLREGSFELPATLAQ